MNPKDDELLKAYIDTKYDSLKTYVDSNLASDRKAVDQYSKTNDEWKLLHNGLQRKMEDDRNMYVTREMLDKQTQLILSRVMMVASVLGLLITAYAVFFK